jgi:hypothetical protein
MAEIPPVTFDPRQAKIHEQLLRLGPGPAAFFRDACRLFQDSPPLETAGYLAGHLLREIKSSVKDVLLPPEADTKSDAEAIAAIAAAFGLPADHDVVKIWPELNLDRAAHRRRLDAPRTLADLREAWEIFQTLLSALLDAFESAYVTVYARIDHLLAKNPPGEKDCKELRGKIPNNPHTLSYFFGRVTGRRWFDLLVDSSMFDDPPDSGAWPQVLYLRRVAGDFSDEVAAILERVATTPNIFTQMEILGALPSLPTRAVGPILIQSARAVTKLGGQDSFMARSVADRVAAIANDEREAALTVFVTLLELKATTEEPKGGYFGSQELKSCLDYYSYVDVIGEPLHAMIEAAPQQAFGTLLDLLDGALALVYEKSKPDDFSKGWMPAIEPHDQNDYHNEPLPRLAEVLRDAAEAVCRHDEVALTAVVRALDARRWQVLQRLALHLLRRFGAANDPLVRDRVMDADIFFESYLRHEYRLLLASVFQSLTDEDRQMICRWIRGGPRLKPERFASTEREKSYRDRWTLQRLAWLRDNLNAEDAATLAALEKAHGTPDESAEFSGYISSRVGSPSPKSEDELRAWPIPDFTTYLQSWQPSGEHFAPTREGLASHLQAIVKARAAEFAAAADSFIGLDATYVRAIVAGFEAAVRENVVLDWGPVLRLCVWAVAQPRGIPGRDGKSFDSDPSWSWAWAAIARLLRAGFGAKGDAELPPTFRETVWKIIAPITDDPDPDEDRQASDPEPYSVAINSTRGVAIEALVHYAIWLRRGVVSEQGVRGFADMPEVEEVLNRHVDPAIDPSRAIRAVYGERLFSLHQISPTWVEKHLGALFPADRPELADTVLHAYLAWGRYMSPDLNSTLTPQFRRAIATLPAEVEDKAPAYAHNLVHRFVAMYHHGETNLAAGSLLTEFFARADEKTRAYAISLVPNAFRDTEGREAMAVRDRCLAFWEWRLATSTDTDLRGFGRWMRIEQFDAAWRLAQLATVLQRVGVVDMDYQIVAILGGFADAHPAETLRCVRLLVGPRMDSMRLHALVHSGDLRKILRAAVRAPSDSVRKDATAFTNELLARGFTQFRDVLDPDGNDAPDF